MRCLYLVTLVCFQAHLDRLELQGREEALGLSGRWDLQGRLDHLDLLDTGEFRESQDLPVEEDPGGQRVLPVPRVSQALKDLQACQDFQVRLVFKRGYFESHNVNKKLECLMALVRAFLYAQLEPAWRRCACNVLVGGGWIIDKNQKKKKKNSKKQNIQEAKYK